MEEQAKKQAVCPNCGKPMRRAITSREFGGQISKCPWCKKLFGSEESKEEKDSRGEES